MMDLTDPAIQSSIISAAAPTVIPTAFIIGAAIWLRQDNIRLRNSMQTVFDRLATIDGKIAGLEAGSRMTARPSATPEGGPR